MSEIGDLVWAKLRGYPYWPAQIVKHGDNRMKNRRNFVYFYGTHNYAWIPETSICGYSENIDKFANKKYRLSFQRAISEVQNILLEKDLPPEETRKRSYNGLDEKVKIKKVEAKKMKKRSCSKIDKISKKKDLEDKKLKKKSSSRLDKKLKSKRSKAKKAKKRSSNSLRDILKKLNEAASRSDDNVKRKRCFYDFDTEVDWGYSEDEDGSVLEGTEAENTHEEKFSSSDHVETSVMPSDLTKIDDNNQVHAKSENFPVGETSCAMSEKPENVEHDETFDDSRSSPAAHKEISDALS